MLLGTHRKHPVRVMCEGVERRKALLIATTPQRILHRLRGFEMRLGVGVLLGRTPRLPTLHRDV